MLQVAFLDRIASSSQVIERGLHIAGIPGGNNIQQKTQAGCAVELTGEIEIGEHTTLSVGDITDQTMHRFPLIEHASHAAAVWLV